MGEKQYFQFYFEYDYIMYSIMATLLSAQQVATWDTHTHTREGSGGYVLKVTAERHFSILHPISQT